MPQARPSIQHARGLSRLAIGMLIMAWVGVLPGTARAQELPAVGDGENLWVLRPDPMATKLGKSRLIVWHRHGSDPGGTLHRGPSLTNAQLVPGGLTAAGDRVWMVNQSGTVKSIRASAAAIPGRWDYAAATHLALPKGVTVRAMGANGNALWALVSVKDATALKAIDALAAPASGETGADSSKKPTPERADSDGDGGKADAEQDQSKSGRDADAGDGKGAKQNSGDEPPSLAPGNEAMSQPADRLIYLRGRTWRSVPLPTDWPTGATSWLLFRDPAQRAPRLFVEQVVGDTQRSLLAYDLSIAAAPEDEAGDKPKANRRNEAIRGEWTRSSLAFSDADPGSGEGATGKNAGANFGLIASQGQYILHRHTGDEKKLSVAMSLLRGDRFLPLGELTLPEYKTGDPWAVTSADYNIALLSVSESGQLQSAYIDIRGKVIGAVTGFQHDAALPMTDALPYVVLVTVLLISSLILFAFWKRDPNWNQLKLPESIGLSDAFARAAAAIIDLVPAFAIAMILTGKNLSGILQFWPGQAQSVSWDLIAPGAIVMAVYIGHCTFSEIMRGQSLGKRMMGTYVANLDGHKPKAWQIVVRNLTKALDLIAWPLMIVVVLSPHRQRLGDLVARTVVIVGPPLSDESDDDGASIDMDDEG